MMRPPRRLPRLVALALTAYLVGCADKDDTAADADAGGSDTGDTGGGEGNDASATNPSTSGASQTTQSSADDEGTTAPADSGSEEGGFITPPDGGIEGQCDPGAQDCPKGEKCTAYVSTPGGATVDANKCVPDMGDKQFGEMCERMTDNDDCDVGLFCMTDISGNTGPGFCLEFCEVDDPLGSCENGGTCIGFNDGTLPLCQNECDPLIQDCPSGQGCYAALDTFVCAGTANDPGSDGDECLVIQGCNPGLVCISGPAGCTDRCCTPICDLNGDGTECVDPSESCVPASENPKPGLENVGFCVVPE